MSSLLTYRLFTGNAAELAQVAVECALSMGLDIDPDKTNERLIRYYQAEGVLDRPDRAGRDSIYHYRQLVQLLSARRMVMAGLPLALATEKNLTSNTDELEKALLAPLPNSAELLVSRFKSGGESAPSFSSRSKSSPVRQPVAVVDVLAEVQALKRDMQAEVGLLRELQRDLKQLRDELGYQREAVERERQDVRALLSGMAGRHEEFMQLLKNLEK